MKGFLSLNLRALGTRGSLRFTRCWRTSPDAARRCILLSMGLRGGDRDAWRRSALRRREARMMCVEHPGELRAALARLPGVRRRNRSYHCKPPFSTAWLAGWSLDYAWFDDEPAHRIGLE